MVELIKFDNNGFKWSLFSGDEMFSDIYKVKVSDSGIFFEVEGKVSQDGWTNATYFNMNRD